MPENNEAPRASNWAEFLRNQVSLKSIWARLVRMTLAGAGLIQGLGHWPQTAPEWAGLVIAVGGASLTGR